MNLESHEFFSFFEPADVDKLQEAATVRSYPAKAIVFDEGDPSDCVYLVLSGLVELCKRADQQSYLTIAYGVENDFFGELGVLDGSVRSTRAITVGDTILAAVPKEAVLGTLRQAAGLTAIGVFNRTIQHLRATDERYVAEVVRKEKMAMVGEMAATIIHDLKNPIQSVLLASTFIREKHVDENTQKWSRIIHDQVHLMVGMVEELLEFSRGTQRLHRETVSVADLLQKFFLLNQDHLIRQKVELELKPVDAVVNADANKLLRVFQNLTYNAAEAFGGRGGNISICGVVVNGEVEIRVRDNGPGVPEEIKDRLFEPFVTAGKKGGTGLGLAITRSIVEAHSGRIWFESKTGEGTTFYLRLPVVGSARSSHAS
jgi:signal transduction histidine kinase